MAALLRIGDFLSAFRHKSAFRNPQPAMARAPRPAITLNNTATLCVAKMPTVGTSTESVTQAPNAAPTVLMP